MKKFRVSENISLALENGETIIYLNGERFIQCKKLLLNVPLNNTQIIENVTSIDIAAENLGWTGDRQKGVEYRLTSDIEFWGHCSNIQAWYENNYDTNLLHSNLAFPLLKKLYELGDMEARRYFKEEIFKRLESGYAPVIYYLCEENYINYLTDDDLFMIFEKSDLPSIIEKLIRIEIKSSLKIQEIVNELSFLRIIKDNNRDKFKRILLSLLKNLDGNILLYICEMNYLEFIRKEEIKELLTLKQLTKSIGGMVELLLIYDNIYLSPMKYLIEKLSPIFEKFIETLFKMGNEKLRMYLEYNNFLSSLDRSVFWDSLRKKKIDINLLIQIEKCINKKMKIKERFAYKLWDDDSAYNSTKDNYLWIRTNKTGLKEVGMRNIELSKKKVKWILKKLYCYKSIEYLIIDDINIYIPELKKKKKIIYQL